MKRILSIIISISLVSSALVLTSCKQTGAKNELKIFNNGEYISDGSDGSIDVIKEFEKETGIKVTAYDTYDSNEQMYAKLKSGSADYDVVIPSDYMISRLINEGMLEKIDTTKLTNYHQVMDEYKGSRLKYDPTDQYSVPYTWGHVAIVYNEKMVEKLTGQKASSVVTGWDALWNEKLKDQIFMFISSRDSFGIAQKSLGFSFNTNSKDELDQCYHKLRAQKPLVQAYVMDEMFDKMENNEAAISPAYAGDITVMMEKNPDLRYCFPKEGANLFVDCACITKDSKNKENAMKFIDFLCRSDIAHANSSFINYSTPIKGAYEMLDDEDRENKIMYPPKEILEKCETFLSLKEETYAYMETLWTKVRK